jgi:hypothetical protein
MILIYILFLPSTAEYALGANRLKQPDWRALSPVAAKTSQAATFTSSRQSTSPPIAIDDTFWADRGKLLNVGPPGVLGNDIAAGGNPRLYYLGGDQHVYELAWFDTDWHTLDITTDAQGTPAASDSSLQTLNYRGQPRIYQLGANHHIGELAWYLDAWHFSDLMDEWSAPAAAAASPLATTTVNGQPRVYYLDTLQHIHELAWSDDTRSWSHNDLTALLVATPADPHSVLSAVTTTNGDPRVFYWGGANHFYELAWNGERWFYWDISNEISVPAPIDGTPLTAIAFNSDLRVYYLSAGSNGRHIHELAYYDFAWHHSDLTNISGSPNPVDTSALAATLYHNTPRLYYTAAVGAQDHIFELAWDSGVWHDTDLTATTSAAAMRDGSAVAVVTYNTEPRVYFFTTDHQVGEFAWMSYLDPANARWYFSIVGAELDAEPARVGSPLGVTIANLKPLRTQLVSDVQHGTLTLYDEGSFVYTPDTGYEGIDTFTYRADDTEALSDETLVTIGVAPPAIPIDVNIHLYRTPSLAERVPYSNVVGYFADALYESSNGARKLGTVTIYANTPVTGKTHIVWTARCHPCASVGAFPANYIGDVNMCDIFEDCDDQGCSEVVNFLSNRENIEHAGYTLAHEWGHYYFGLYDEYRGPDDGRWDLFFDSPHSTDEPVIPSIMNSQWNTINGSQRNYNWLNFSTANNAKQATAQYRVYGASGWDTLARPLSADPIGGSRQAYRDLQNVAPSIGQDARIELPGAARSALQIVWKTPIPAAVTTPATADANYTVQLVSAAGPVISYPEPMRLLASISKDLPLAFVGIQGTVRLPDGRTSPVAFIDDGQLPDEVANDGLYSAILTYATDGVYTIEVRFDNDAGTAAQIATAFQPAAGPEGQPIPLPPPVPVTEPFSLVKTLVVVVSNVVPDDHGNTVTAATSFAANNEQLSGKIDHVGDSDVFRFKTIARGTTYVRITDCMLGMTPKVRVFGADGATVLGEAEAGATTARYLFLPLTDVVPETTIYVVVSDVSSAAVGGLYKISAGAQLASDVSIPLVLYLPYVAR